MIWLVSEKWASGISSSASALYSLLMDVDPDLTVGIAPDLLVIFWKIRKR
jgi:hypothetical protein